MSSKSNKKSTKASKQNADGQPFNLDILSVIKLAQNQHGMRHSDFQRYRQYCSKKVYRIHKASGHLHGRKKFSKKDIDPTKVENSRLLLLVLFYAERCWSNGMHLKGEIEIDRERNARKKFHVVRKLKKASKWGALLLQMCTNSGNEATKIQAEAYSSFLTGVFKFEKEIWQEAYADLVKSRAIYEQLSKIGTPEFQEYCKSKTEEIFQSIRICNYKLKNTEKLQNLNELAAPGMELLQSKLDSVVNDTLKQQIAELKEVTWKARKIPIKTEKVRLSLAKVEESALELSKEKWTTLKSEDEIFSKYSPIFALLSEAERNWEEENKPKGKQGKIESPEDLKALSEYLTYLTLQKTYERSLAVLSLWSEWENSEKQKQQEEIIKVYDIIIQTCTQMLSLFENTDVLHKEISAKIQLYKGVRCYHLSQNYLNQSKYAESNALLDKSANYIAISKVGLKETNSKELSSAESFEFKISGKRLSNKAASFLSELDKQSPNLASEDLKLMTEKELLSTFSFPPEFEPVKCKPLLFDLALNLADYPNLEERKKAKSTSFWGFWRSN